MSNLPLKNDLIIRAARREPVEYTPIWIMRQAGRYLPQYQAVRAKSDFLSMCRTPELAAEVTLQPIDILGVDGAIIFSDILVIPEAMGMTLDFYEGRGPVFERPLRQESDFSNLREVDAEQDLHYVLEALRLVRKELAGRVPLIGFAGAPWTLAAYMIEGHGSRNFGEIKRFMYTRPDLLHSLLEKLADAVTGFLEAQIKAGAQIVQLFDSWAAILPPDHFRMFSLPYLKKIAARLRKHDVPVVVFAREANHSFGALSQIGADVLGVSWSADLADVRLVAGDQVAVQGNLDPTALLATPAEIRQEVRRILRQAGPKPGHIFNLGHGILPETPVDNARALVDFVHEESRRG